jgi:uncharacterized phage infection (PIP) family protein YhgE
VRHTTALLIFLPTLLTLNSYSQSGQTPDPFLAELTKISRSVQSLSERFKTFAEKGEEGKSPTLNERQQKMILGVNLLVAAEQRVINLQKFQIELTQVQNDLRNRLSQVEVDLRPRSIDRSVAFEGTTETDELRESKRSKLTAERISLTALIRQVQTNLAETSETLKDAQDQAIRMRRQIMPQIERELADQ